MVFPSLDVFEVGNLGFVPTWDFQTVLIDPIFICLSLRELKELLEILASLEEHPLGILQ